MLLKENRKLCNSKEFVFAFTVAVLIQLIFIRSENPRNEHVTCVGRYADVIRLVCEHIFLLEALFKSLPCFQCSAKTEAIMAGTYSLKRFL